MIGHVPHSDVHLLLVSEKQYESNALQILSVLCRTLRSLPPASQSSRALKSLLAAPLTRECLLIGSVNMIPHAALMPYLTQMTYLM